MILTRVMELLAAREVASLTEIAHALDSAPDAVRSMLQTLQRKGLVHRLEPGVGCGSSCGQCAQGAVEVYGHGPQPAQAHVGARCAGPE